MESISSLIDAAGKVLRNIPRNNDDHNVAAAARSKDGRVFSAVNVYHFTGGPCAEVVALGVAAAQGVLAPDIDCMVTVQAEEEEGKTGEIRVLNPCGRCRQTMIDYNPDMRVVIVGDEGKLAVVGVRELLPWAYIQPKEGQAAIERESTS